MFNLERVFGADTQHVLSRGFRIQPNLCWDLRYLGVEDLVSLSFRQEFILNGNCYCF